MCMPFAVIGSNLTAAAQYCQAHGLPQRLARSPRAVRNGALDHGKADSLVLLLDGVKLTRFDRAKLAPFEVKVVHNA